jgi:hypothetical protein
MYATDLNCYHKMKIGWIPPSEVITIDVPDVNSTDFKPRDAATRTFLNSLKYRLSNETNPLDTPQCLVVKIPEIGLPGQVNKYDRVVMEYRQPSTADKTLQNLVNM